MRDASRHATRLRQFTTLLAGAMVAAGAAGCFRCVGFDPGAGTDGAAPCAWGEPCQWGDTRCAGETVEYCTIVERPFCSWYEQGESCTDVGLVCEAGGCIVLACGDGWVSGAEACDDGALLPGDGCDESCALERGSMCTGEPSACCRDECLELGKSYCDAAASGVLKCVPGPSGCLVGELAIECAEDEQCVRAPGGASCSSVPPPSRSGYALELDGVDDVVDCGALPYGLPLATYTIELWMRLEPGRAPAMGGTLMQKRPDVCGPPGPCSFRLLADGNCILLEPCGDGPVPLCETTLYPCEGCNVGTGECSFDGWHHYAFLNDQATDCSNFVQDAGPGPGCAWIGLGTLAASSWPLLFGRRADCAAGCAAFEGAIDEVRIWSYWRTGPEMTATMYTSLAGDEPGLVAYWPFDDGGDTALEVVSGTLCTLGDASGPDPADPVWTTDRPF